MDTIDYNQKEKEILSVIPKHFHSTLSYMAYERGHSAGEEEVLGCLQGLVGDLRDVINSYKP